MSATAEAEGKAFPELLSDVLDIAFRRKFYMLIPFVVVSFVAVVVALKLPAVYRSKGTILIEEQQIPKSLVPTTITDYADQRIHLIKQRVMTRDRIFKLIDRYHLYEKEQQRLMPSELVKKFQDDAKVEMISADVRAERGGKATIAFTISFDNRQPETAQAVANELVSMFLAENTRVRTERATKTTDFLADEAEGIKREIDNLETQIAEYKQQFGRSLPELLPSNLAVIERLTGDLRQTEGRIHVLEDRIAYLTAELPRVRQQAPLPQPGVQAPQSKDEQLRVLKAEYLNLSSRYHPKHPDVLRVERQLKAIDPNFKEGAADEQAAAQLEAAQAELDLLEQKYSASHPDVVKAKERVALLRQRSPEAPSRPEAELAEPDESRDPMYVNLMGQLRSSQSDVENLRKQRQELLKVLEDYHRIVDQTPQVERHYQQLVRERESTVQKFVELKAKAREAKLAQTLEEEQKGESFTLIDPPVVPDLPEKPNRQKIALMGILLAALAGAGCAFLIETLQGSVRGQKALEALVGMPALVVIPYIETEADLKLRRRRRTLWLAGMAVCLVLGLILIHFLVKPLPLIWTKIGWYLQRI